MKKKILFFTNGLYGGGAEQILLTLLTHIDYTLFNITLYSLTKDDVTKEYPEQIHYNYIFHPISDQDNCWRRITKKIINKFTPNLSSLFCQIVLRSFCQRELRHRSSLY